MNSVLTELTFGDQRVLVSTVVPAGSEETSAANRLRERAVDALQQAGEAIEAVAKSVSETAGRLAKAAAAPTGIEVELGLAFTAQGGVVVAGGGVQASIVVHLSYDMPPVGP
ncbi:CU044_2847 family protein [Streptomyces prunicolor]|uniref:CU044_2847 family protein n=1 Tax=Streptomyces prunicolor TaxID=67348 RepID=UPI0034062FD5